VTDQRLDFLREECSGDGHLLLDLRVRILHTQVVLHAKNTFLMLQATVLKFVFQVQIN